MNTVLISGGSGLIGKHLSDLLISKGYIVHILSRKPNEPNTFLWNINEDYIDHKAFENVDYIIHLAGAGIVDKKWTAKRKQEIINSRVNSTKLLYKYIKELNVPLKAFISSSAIGYYGAITTNKVLTEEEPVGKDFVAHVCYLWEKAAQQVNNHRLVILRTGIVLSNKGGALQKMLAPVISPLGSGNQMIPWIHINDLVNMFLFAIENEQAEGTYNAVAPNPVNNREFSKQLASTFKKPYLPLPVPGFLLKLLLGDRSKLVLTGSKISSNKIENMGFQFEFPSIKNALLHLKK